MFGGHKKTQKERTRENKREIRKNQRELEREKRHLEREEKKLIAEIKKAAKKGDQSTAKRYAKDLVKVRNMKKKFIGMNSQLSSVKHSITATAATVKMGEIMGSTSKVMKKMNKQMNLPELNKTLQRFANQTQQAELSQEMMDDMMDAFDEDVEDEADDITAQVLDEIGVNIGSALPSEPTAALRTKTPAKSNATPKETVDAQMKGLLAELNIS